MGRRRKKRRRGGIFVVECWLILCIFGMMSCITAWHRLEESKKVSAEGMNLERESSAWQTAFWIPFTGLSQAGLPTGCEAVSTTALLRHLGVEIAVEEFIDYYLPKAVFWKRDGRIYGPNPHEYFAGTPYESGGLGCFSEVIVKALEQMKNSGYAGMEQRTIDNLSGGELDVLEDYIRKEIPVVIWVTMGMEASYEGMSYYLENGQRYTWRAGEHCMVLCGFDESYYYLMDPLNNGEVTAYEKKLVGERYEEMGRQAVVVY